MDLADYVLGHFSKEEKERMEQAFKDGAAAAVAMMNDGVDTAMNRFNGAARTVKKTAEKPETEV